MSSTRRSAEQRDVTDAGCNWRTEKAAASKRRNNE